jgi:iron complex outermembrane receptor protein
MRKLSSFLLSASALALGLTGFSTVVQAQGSDEIEEIVVSGLRGKPRSAVDSAVPVDTFNADQIEAVAAIDTVDILQTLVPSYNVSRQPISDGATFIRPAELRGLPSHHTLVLVNGKRRHRASLVSIGGSGTQGPDVATIPSVALQSVEVLRDGASSQYGSDAIAGVINFNLKTNSEGFDLQLGGGEFFEGDGSDYQVQANVGLPLGENGFLSLSGEVSEADFSERAAPYCESWFCVDRNNPRFAGSNDVSRSFVVGDQTLIGPGSVADSGFTLNQATYDYIVPFIGDYPDGTLNPHNASVAGQNVMPWGQPNNEAVRFFANAGIEMDNGMELYAFGNYSDSSGDGSFFHRYPFNGTIELLRNADGSMYFPLEKFPGGFTPRFEGEVEDMSIAGGLRGGSETFAWDVSARYGSNEISYRLFNTINPSMGVDSPTDFRPGDLQNEEMQLQADFSNEFDIGWESPLVFAYGVSYMDETYNVHQSNDVASYAAGPHAEADPYGFCSQEVFADGTMIPDPDGDPGDMIDISGQPNYPVRTPTVAGAGIADLDCSSVANAALPHIDPLDPVYNVVGVGSNGFPGYSPDFSEEYNRDSYAVYADLSGDVTENFFVQAAIRYEDYSDFGDETVGKIAARYRLSDAFAIRGSVGTGFRAPTPGQQGTTNVSTRLPNGFPVATGLFPASGAVAGALGATPLTAETSTSFTLGFTAETDKLSLTVDFYQIEIDDRFNSISTLDVSTDPSAGDAFDNYQALVDAGVSGAESIGGVFYFTNAFDTKTTGVDVVASYPIEWAGGSETTLQFAMNYNENSIESNADDFLNAEEQFDFENFDPNLRWNLTALHSFGDFNIMGRVRYFGEAENSDNTDPLSIQTYDPVFFLDLEGSWQINDNWRVTAGAMNILDEFPDETDRIASDNDFCCGRIYPSGTVAPWQGGYYYARVGMSF